MYARVCLNNYVLLAQGGHWGSNQVQLNWEPNSHLIHSITLRVRMCMCVCMCACASVIIVSLCVPPSYA